MRDAVVQEHTSVEGAHLRALVADDRARQTEALDPRHRAGKRTAGACDDRDAGVDDAVERRDVPRVEVEVQVQDRPVQVQGKQFVPGG
jgi:hypothetical protein